MTKWVSVLELDSRREMTGGSPDALCAAIRRGADLRIYTEFIHNEHIDPASASAELIREVSEFRATYLVEDRWCAGIMTLRQPIALPDAFGPRASMSFFMYNQDGQQAIARPYLDGGTPPGAGTLGPAAPDDWRAYPKYHQQDGWDAGTNAPSSNFIYDFEVFRYFVCDDWQEVLAHDADGRVQAGSIDLLAAAFEAGGEIKVAIRNLCADLAAEPDHAGNRARGLHPGGAGLLLLRAKAVHRGHAPARPRAARHPDALREPGVGFRLAHAAHRWPGRHAVVRSLHVTGAARDATVGHALVRPLKNRPSRSRRLEHVGIRTCPGETAR